MMAFPQTSTADTETGLVTTHLALGRFSSALATLIGATIKTPSQFR
jgi:hypothetical protein